MNTPIKAEDVAEQIWALLVKTVHEEYAGESEEVKNEAVAEIMVALSVQMFK